MADRRATNKYYPPDWDPSKGSINKYVGQHPLRDRARKLDQGILIVRFELPFNIWCEGCQNHVGMGVRYNAEKKKAGMYYSTPIWSFRMKCHLCNHWIEIHTDPKNAEYAIISGARRREEAYNPADIGLPVLQDAAQTEKIATDAFYKLEHQTEDVRKATESKHIITELRELNDKNWKDPYTLSQKLRKRFREDKKERIAVEKEGQAIADKHALLLKILPASEEDERKAKMIKWDAEPETVEEKKAHVHQSSIFDGKPLKRKTNSKYNESPKASSALQTIIAAKSRIKEDPFAVTPSKAATSSISGLDLMVRRRSGEEGSSTTSGDGVGEDCSTGHLVCGDYGDSDED